MNLSKAYEDLYSIIKEIYPKVYELNIKKDEEFLIGTFSLDKNIDNLSKDDWIQQTKEIDLGHLSFLLNSKATLKSIYNEANNINKEKLIVAFSNLCNKVQSMKRFSKMCEKLSNNIEQNSENNATILHIVSNFKEYKKPEYLSYILDQYTMNFDFRKYLLNQINSKSKNIDDNNILNDEEKEKIYESFKSFEELTDNNYINIFIEFFDFIMKINLIGTIGVSSEIHLYISNYIINLFKNSKFLSKVIDEIDKRYKVYEKSNDKSKYILRDCVSKINCMESLLKKRKLNIHSGGFRGLINVDDNKEIVYKVKSLKSKIVHIILKVIEMIQLSIMSDDFKSHNKNYDIKSLFKKEIDQTLLENISFTSIVNIILTNDIDDVIDKEKLKDFVKGILLSTLTDKSNEKFIDIIMEKIDYIFIFFKENIIDQEVISIINKAGELLDNYLNLDAIKRLFNNKRKILKIKK